MTQNIYAPFALPIHLVFCIIATIFYAYMYKRKGYKHYFYLIFAIDLTLISQFYPDGNVIFALGIFEIILLVLIFHSIFKISTQKKREEKMKNSIGNDVNKNLEYDKDIIDDAFFDDEF